MSDVTQILVDLERGDCQAAEKLLPLVYAELRRLAAWKLGNEQPDQTLQATALVHEAYLRLVSKGDSRWNGRRHFFGAAAEAMRRILIENARRKRRAKHGGGLDRVPIDQVDLPYPLPDDDLIALDEALGQLAGTDPRAAELVKLCFFAGLTQEQAAKAMGISISTVKRTLASCGRHLRWPGQQDLCGRRGARPKKRRHPAPIVKNSWDLCVGNSVIENSGGQFMAYEGLIDEVRIYNHALAADDNPPAGQRIYQ